MGTVLKLLVTLGLCFGAKHIYVVRQAHALAEVQAKTEDAQFYYVHPEDSEKIHKYYDSASKEAFYDSVAVGNQTRYLELPSGRTLSFSVSREITGYCHVDGHPFYKFNFRPLKPIKVIDATGATIEQFTI